MHVHARMVMNLSLLVLHLCLLFLVRCRTPENTPSQIRLDHGCPLVMNGLTQLEYEPPSAFDRVNLAFQWV